MSVDRKDPLRSGAIFREDYLQSLRSPVPRVSGTMRPSFSSPPSAIPVLDLEACVQGLPVLSPAPPPPAAGPSLVSSSLLGSVALPPPSSSSLRSSLPPPPRRTAPPPPTQSSSSSSVVSPPASFASSEAAAAPPSPPPPSSSVAVKCPVPVYGFGSPVNQSFEELCQRSPLPQCVKRALEQRAAAARTTQHTHPSTDRGTDQRVHSDSKPTHTPTAPRHDARGDTRTRRHDDTSTNSSTTDEHGVVGAGEDKEEWQVKPAAGAARDGGGRVPPQARTDGVVARVGTGGIADQGAEGAATGGGGGRDGHTGTRDGGDGGGGADRAAGVGGSRDSGDRVAGRADGETMSYEDSTAEPSGAKGREAATAVVEMDEDANEKLQQQHTGAELLPADEDEIPGVDDHAAAAAYDSEAPTDPEEPDPSVFEWRSDNEMPSPPRVTRRSSPPFSRNSTPSRTDTPTHAHVRSRTHTPLRSPSPPPPPPATRTHAPIAAHAQTRAHTHAPLRSPASAREASSPMLSPVQRVAGKRSGGSSGSVMDGGGGDDTGVSRASIEKPTTRSRGEAAGTHKHRKDTRSHAPVTSQGSAGDSGGGGGGDDDKRGVVEPPSDVRVLEADDTDTRTGVDVGGKHTHGKHTTPRIRAATASRAAGRRRGDGRTGGGGEGSTMTTNAGSSAASKLVSTDKLEGVSTGTTVTGTEGAAVVKEEEEEAAAARKRATNPLPRAKAAAQARPYPPTRSKAKGAVGGVNGMAKPKASALERRANGDMSAQRPPSPPTSRSVEAPRTGGGGGKPGAAAAASGVGSHGKAFTLRPTTAIRTSVTNSTSTSAAAVNGHDGATSGEGHVPPTTTGSKRVRMPVLAYWRSEHAVSTADRGLVLKQGTPDALNSGMTAPPKAARISGGIPKKTEAHANADADKQAYTHIPADAHTGTPGGTASIPDSSPSPPPKKPLAKKVVTKARARRPTTSARGTATLAAVALKHEPSSSSSSSSSSESEDEDFGAMRRNKTTAAAPVAHKENKTTKHSTAGTAKAPDAASKKASFKEDTSGGAGGGKKRSGAGAAKKPPAAVITVNAGTVGGGRKRKAASTSTTDPSHSAAVSSARTGSAKAQAEPAPKRPRAQKQGSTRAGPNAASSSAPPPSSSELPFSPSYDKQQKATASSAAPLAPPAAPAAAPAAAATETSSERAWSKTELQALRDAVQMRVPPSDRNFWKRVASYVPGRKASECHTRWFQELEEDGGGGGKAKSQGGKKRKRVVKDEADGEKENNEKQELTQQPDVGRRKVGGKAAGTGRGKGKKAKLREMVREYAAGGSDDDVFVSTPGTKRRTSKRRGDSLLRLSFLDEEMSSGGENDDSDDHGDSRRASLSRQAPAVTDQYLNRVISQVRPKAKKDAQSLAAHSHAQTHARSVASLHDVRVTDHMGAYRVLGKMDVTGKVCARVRRDDGSSSSDDGNKDDEDVRREMEEEREEEELRAAAGGRWKNLLKG